MIKGIVIGGEFGKVIARQRSDSSLELGEIVVADHAEGKILMQVYDLLFGSQISSQNLELISGMKLEDNAEFEIMDSKLRNYNLALLKTLVSIRKDKASVSKVLPNFFSEVREITKGDLSFITTPKNPLFIGKLRSGSKEMDVDIALPGDETLSHHILVPATTGRGKSNLTYCILWNLMQHDYAGVLVLDPHDEYFGRNKTGLKDNSRKDKLSYYTPNNVPTGQKTLRINLSIIKPGHFNGVADFSDPQQQALNAYYKKYGYKWIEAIMLEKPIEDMKFHEGTLAVVKRTIMSILDLELKNNELKCNSIFHYNGGETTIKEIVGELESSKIVIVDTSSFSGQLEILIGSMITTELFSRYKYYKVNGKLGEKPVISIVIEEAPRVLGKEVLEKGPNIFSTIAREGRKFKVGLFAITQLPSLIPRQILANMNTKIILGIEMAPERQAVIDSAAQDLSDDNRNIAALDKGEAIITSNFAKFATPVKIPLFEEIVKKERKPFEKKSFDGIRLG